MKSTSRWIHRASTTSGSCSAAKPAAASAQPSTSRRKTPTIRSEAAGSGGRSSRCQRRPSPRSLARGHPHPRRQTPPWPLQATRRRCAGRRRQASFRAALIHRIFFAAHRVPLTNGTTFRILPEHGSAWASILPQPGGLGHTSGKEPAPEEYAWSDSYQVARHSARRGRHPARLGHSGRTTRDLAGGGEHRGVGFLAAGTWRPGNRSAATKNYRCGFECGRREGSRRLGRSSSCNGRPPACGGRDSSGCRRAAWGSVPTRPPGDAANCRLPRVA